MNRGFVFFRKVFFSSVRQIFKIRRRVGRPTQLEYFKNLTPQKEKRRSEKSKLAGLAGFEPAHDGIKTRCLTAWRQPN